MSELEKRQRDAYQKKRQKWIFIELIVAAALLLATIFTFVPYTVLNNNAYVYYAEDGKANTKVYLENNEFYKPDNGYNEDYLNSSYAYVAELIDNIKTEFKYALKLDTDTDTEYKYGYSVDAIINVVDRDSKAPLYAPTYNVIPKKSLTAKSNTLYISETVDIKYAEYNKKAKAFVEKYGVADATANLILRFNISVLGKSETLAEDKSNTYSMEVVIPLLRQTIKLTTQSSVPAGEQKILASDTALKNVLLVLWIIFLCLTLLAGGFTAAFVILTRDKHIDYARRVQKLLSSYKSYIQRISNPFDFEGYKVLNVVTFTELLEIGDKLQNPVLMYENEDKTRSEFFIATCNSIIYLYTVEVKNEAEDFAVDYTNDYTVTPITEASEEEAAAEDNTIKESFEEKINEQLPQELKEENDAAEPDEVLDTAEAEESLTEPMAEEEISDESAAVTEEISEEAAEESADYTAVLIISTEEENEEEIGENAEGADFVLSGALTNLRLRRSFMSRYIQSDENVQKYYSAIKNRLLSYKGVKARVSWRAETFKKGRTHIAKIDVKGKKLFLYLALDPADFTDSKYFFTDMSSKDKNLPMLLKIKSDRGEKHAVELIEILAQKLELDKTSLKNVDYRMPFETNEALIAKGLVKIISGSTASAPAPAPKMSIAEPLNEKAPAANIVTEEEPQATKAFEEKAPELVIEVTCESDTANTVEAIDIKWEDDARIYRYDPNGETVDRGDTVLVPTTIEALGEVEREAEVAKGNYRIPADKLEKPLKKIIAVIRRKMQSLVTPSDNTKK